MESEQAVRFVAPERRWTSNETMSIARALMVMAVLAGIQIGDLAFHAGRDLSAAEGLFDVAPGQPFLVRPQDMPPPYATPAGGNGPRQIRRPDDTRLRVPDGFVVNAYAEGLSHARWLAVAPNGDVFLSQSKAGEVTLLRDFNGDGTADLTRRFLSGLRGPHGVAFHDGALYVADVRGVWRLPYEPGDLAARARPERITPDGALGNGRGHWTRNVVFDPDGSRFFVTVGSASNLGEDGPPRATVRVFDADGSGGRSFATGLRNPVGIAFRPGSEELYVVVNERDGMGDELVPDYLTRIVDGDFFGWPYAYIGPNPQPQLGAKQPDQVAQTKLPDVLFRSHATPLGLAFYDGTQFPEDYQGDAFVALHGSWNAAQPRGYMVVRVPFVNGRPAAGYEAFVTGFWVAGDQRAIVWGRPAGLAVATDGSLLIADDVSNTIWRVSYRP